MTTISIVTPSLNQGQFIEQTFKSIIKQKGNFKIQYIIVDGMSTDKTHEVIKKYIPKFRKAKIDFIQIIEKDLGQADAINKGFKKAKGEILTFLNADDFYTPKSLIEVINYFNSHPNIDWLFGGWNIVNESGKTFKTFQPKTFSEIKFKTYGFNIGQPSCFFKEKLLKKVGGLRTNLHLALDYDLWLRFLRISKPGLVLSVLSNLRYHQQAKSSQNMAKHNFEAFMVAKKYLAGNSLLWILLYFNYTAGWLAIKMGRNISQQVK